jgi:hypothetical protein
MMELQAAVAANARQKSYKLLLKLEQKAIAKFHDEVKQNEKVKPL